MLNILLILSLFHSAYSRDIINYCENLPKSTCTNNMFCSWCKRNSTNNSLNNLIAVPKKVHTVIHQTGYLNRNEINNLIQLYNMAIKIK